MDDQKATQAKTLVDVERELQAALRTNATLTQNLGLQMDLARLKFEEERAAIKDERDKFAIETLTNKRQLVDDHFQRHAIIVELRAIKVQMIALEVKNLLLSVADSQPRESVRKQAVQEVSDTASKELIRKEIKAFPEALSPAYQAKSAKEIRNIKGTSRKSLTSKLAELDSESEDEAYGKRNSRSLSNKPNDGRESTKSKASVNSSSKKIKSKPRFSTKSTGSTGSGANNAFAAFDLTKRMAAPKLKST